MLHVRLACHRWQDTGLGPVYMTLEVFLLRFQKVPQLTTPTYYNLVIHQGISLQSGRIKDIITVVVQQIFI